MTLESETCTQARLQNRARQKENVASPEIAVRSRQSSWILRDTPVRNLGISPATSPQALCLGMQGKIDRPKKSRPLEADANDVQNGSTEAFRTPSTAQHREGRARGWGRPPLY